MTVILLGVAISLFLILVIFVGNYTKLKSSLLFLVVFSGFFYLFIAYTVFESEKPQVSDRMVEMYYADQQ